MSYEALEVSEQSGAPVELYLFQCGNQAWRYTSAERDVTFDGETWTSVPISRNKTEATMQEARDSLEITMRRDLAVPELFRVSPRTEVVAVVVFRYHRGDLGQAVVWMGDVLNVEWSGAAARLRCDPVSISFGRTGLRRLYQKPCPHVLYGTGCKVDKELHGRVCEVTAIDGATITVDGLDAKPYAGGFVVWDMGGGNLERRFIRSFTGLVLTLARPFQGLPIAATVTVYPGCNHTMDHCDTFFANLPNYGGMPYFPTKNPFDGTPVY